MRNTPAERLAFLLGISPDALNALDAECASRCGRRHVLDKVDYLMRERIHQNRVVLGIPKTLSAHESLLRAIYVAESAILARLRAQGAGDEFSRAIELVRKMTRAGKGFFLKKEKGREILRRRPPQSILSYFGYADVEELLTKHEITEIFAALRFMESEEWMHETFKMAYGDLSPFDFERREIEFRVLGKEWEEVGKAFVAKKHHNVSHLKEFGVVFLNPIAQDGKGKFFRDFALLFHYFHEVDFYSELFLKAAEAQDFPEKVASLLRGDVPETSSSHSGEWFIIQRYLGKENPADPRLLVPHVNPESVHWMRAERDIADYATEYPELCVALWRGMDFVGEENPDGSIVSYDLEDNAMSAVSATEGKGERFSYHQREALWTRLFMEYAGGEEAMSGLLVSNFMKGSIQF